LLLLWLGLRKDGWLCLLLRHLVRDIVRGCLLQRSRVHQLGRLLLLLQRRLH
jgi:hypothetical protein